MDVCTTAGCNNVVAKPGYTLCFSCWKATRSAKPISLKSTSPSTESLPATPKTLSATRLGEHFNIRPYKVNPILAELGLLEKIDNGWAATPRGLAIGAQEKVDSRKNSQYVIWPSEVLESSVFLFALQTVIGDSTRGAVAETAAQISESEFREKFRDSAKHRTNDGHWVRSKAETLIDNWLYVMGLVHAYERRLPVEKEAYCDFYIPQGRIYIEYWGFENDPKYTARKQEKIKLYQLNELNLIELTNEHVEQLDDCLPVMLRRFGVRVE